VGVKRGLVIAITVVLAGLATATYRASVRWRADGLRRSADAACRQFDFVAAHVHLQGYLEVCPTDPSALLLAGQCARRAELLEDFCGPDTTLRQKASEYLAVAERQGAQPAAVTLERALSRVQEGRLGTDEGLLLKRVQTSAANAPLILEALIHGYLRNLQCEKALLCAEALLKLEPSNVLALLWRGRIREQTRQVRSARQDYELALQVVPEFDPVRYYLAESLLRSNRLSEAAPHLKALIARAGTNLLVRLAWAKYRIAGGDASGGEELLRSWMADAPKDHPRMLEALTASASLALAQGRPADAEAFARRALQESPLDQYALHDLAQSLRAQGRVQDAQQIEEKLQQIKTDLRLVSSCRDRLAKSPNDLELRHQIGAAYLRVGRTGEALVWLNSVLDREPNHLATLRVLADLHAQSCNQALADQLRLRIVAHP
jgi:predicted Zn-dependent protease